MNLRSKSTDERVWLRILCAIALVLVGLAHQPPGASASPIPPDRIAEYTLPDGTVPDLCFPFGTGKSGQHVSAADCEACRLSNDVTLPVPSQAGIRIVSRAAFIHHTVRADPPRRQFIQPDSSPRAPPFSTRIA